MSDFDDEPIEGTEPVDAAEPVDAVDPVDEPEEPAAPAPTAKKKPAPKSSTPDDDWDDDWDDEDDGRSGGRRDMTLIYAIVAAAIVIVLAVVLTRPKDDNSNNAATNNGGSGATTQPTAPVKNWQGPVGDAVGKDGADAQKRAESAAGVYIWTDFGGWHLRSNNTSDVKVTVAADQVRVKKTDDGKDSDENADAPFATETVVTLPAGDAKTGVGLDLGTSESATFTVTIDGKNVPATGIFLGGAEGVADQNPVTFVKG